ncbi:unnamed protein product [Meloidogyne enterolobii]|uniref:Uncharacterized protein n=1 Tax=Meloidogyne enterolobii TaxID=390850 RepID=A0ACB1AUQ5_MELEN
MFSLDLRTSFTSLTFFFTMYNPQFFAKMALHSLITCFSIAESPIFLLHSIHFIANFKHCPLYFFISLRVYIIVNFSSSLFPCVSLWHIQTVKQYTILLSSFTRIEK